MLRRGKRIIAAKKKVDPTRRYTLKEATEMVVSMAGVKFDETVDAAVRLGVNPAHADQMVRGSVVLPNGLGKTVRVLVFAKGDKEKEALEAGADLVGNDEIIEKIKGGWLEFDRVIATPDMICLLYTSDAADDLLCVDLGGRRLFKKKKNIPVRATRAFTLSSTLSPISMLPIRN